MKNREIAVVRKKWIQRNSPKMGKEAVSSGVPAKICNDRFKELTYGSGLISDLRNAVMADIQELQGHL